MLCIFPFWRYPQAFSHNQLDGEISGEHLSIVRVAAEVYVDARRPQAPAARLRLVVEDNEWAYPRPDLLDDLIGRLARLDAAAPGGARRGGRKGRTSPPMQRALVAQET